MEALSALSVAAAVAQFVDFGFKALKDAREIYGSLSGATEENESLENATREMQRLMDKLVMPDLESWTDEAKSLNALVIECRSLSSQLLSLLDKVKPKNPKSKVQVARAALRSKHYEKEKSRMQRRLDECQLRLDRLLRALSRSKTEKQFDRLITSNGNSASKLATILGHVEELRRSAELTSLGPSAREQLHHLLTFSERLYTKTAQQKILRFLAFPGMRDRIDVVEKAHAETFKWIFDSDAPASGDPDPGDSNRARASVLDQDARKKVDGFVEWLSSGQGVYHIAGKLGSGKSTLMKYLYGHNRVREELQKWAGEAKLVVASFFFWRRGSPLQRSLNGLFRTLLYDALEQRPDLIPEVLPNLWSSVVSFSECEPTTLALESDRLQAAFSRLLRCSTVYDNSRFCFFIDGLDEYEETVQNDYKAMVQLLFSCTEAAPHGIKLCVSSREYNVFLNNFSDDKRLRLQDLTLADMSSYVRERLQELDQAYLSRLVNIITRKADGIFLWVALVVKSIRSRLEDGCGLSMIEDEVNSLPDELEGLFRHLLDSIPKPYRKQAYQTFAIVEQVRAIDDDAPREIRLQFTLLGYSFLDEYGVDREFAQKTHPLCDAASGTSRSEREAAAQRRLNAQCQGLVELGRSNTIIFTHRSVSEFLDRHLRDMAGSVLAGFDPAHALSQLVLAEIRARPRDPYWMDELRGSPRINGLLDMVIVMRHAKGLDCAPFTFLEALGHAARRAVPDPEMDGAWKWRLNYPCRLFLPGVRQWFDAAGSMLCAATCQGYTVYVQWKIGDDPGLVDSEDKIAALVSFAVRGGLSAHAYHKNANPFHIIGMLLRKGVSPNAVVFTNETAARVGGMSTWEYVLLWIATTVIQGGAGPPARCNRMGEVIQDFLEHGANPEVAISLQGQLPVLPEDYPILLRHGQRLCPPLPHHWSRAWSAETWRLQAATDNPRLPETRGGIARPAIQLRFGQNGGEVKTITHDLRHFNLPASPYTPAEVSFYNHVISKGGQITLDEFVEYSKFPNEEAILHLLRSNKSSPGQGPGVMPGTAVLKLNDTGGGSGRPGGGHDQRNEQASSDAAMSAVLNPAGEFAMVVEGQSARLLEEEPAAGVSEQKQARFHWRTKVSLAEVGLAVALFAIVLFQLVHVPA